MKNNDLNAWSGPDALREFLMPGSSMTPMVELPLSLNPFAKKGVRIFAKLLYFLPLLNVKSLMAVTMLKEAEREGALKDVHTIVENSSGNTGFSLGILAKYFGVENVTAIVPYDIAPGKREMLRLAGVKVDEVKQGGIARARELGRQKGFLNLGQYEDDANPKAHETVTAPEIWEQTQGDITLFCAGLGTTGTALGAKRYFKKKGNVDVLGVILEKDSAVPGVRTRKGLEDISFDWKKEIDFCVEIKTKESYKKSLELCQAGLLAGPSSGFALAGLLKFLGEQDKASLQDMRNSHGEVTAVFICADTPMPYLDKYSTFLDPHEF